MQMLCTREAKRPSAAVGIRRGAVHEAIWPGADMYSGIPALCALTYVPTLLVPTY